MIFCPHLELRQRDVEVWHSNSHLLHRRVLDLEPDDGIIILSDDRLIAVQNLLILNIYLTQPCFSVFEHLTIEGILQLSCILTREGGVRSHHFSDPHISRVLVTDGLAVSSHDIDN